MGCSSSKASTNVAMRVMEYQHLANTENEGLTMVPARLDTEEWRDGLMRNVLASTVHPRALFNAFHSGFHSAYIQNPAYMLVVDFRTVEDWIVERVITSHHHERLPTLERSLSDYSLIVLYDSDGTSVGNIRSPLRKVYIKMVSIGLEPKVLLGGVQALQTSPFSSLLDRPRSIPFAVAVQPTVHNSVESLPDTEDSEEDEAPELEEVERAVDPVRQSISWMPNMILDRKLYLGRTDQASDPTVIQSLGITHILSTSRVRATKFRNLVYILVNKASFSVSSLRLTNDFILEALEAGGTVLVHGCDGFDQSAAVVTAALMRLQQATLEDSLWYLETCRPGVSLSSPVVQILATLEQEMFGRPLSDVSALWCYNEQ